MKMSQKAIKTQQEHIPCYLVFNEGVSCSNEVWGFVGWQNHHCSTTVAPPGGITADRSV